MAPYHTRTMKAMVKPIGKVNQGLQQLDSLPVFLIPKDEETSFCSKHFIHSWAFAESVGT